MEQIKKPRNRAIRNIREKRSLRALILMSRRDSREKEIAAMEQIKKSRNRAIRNIREKRSPPWSKSKNPAIAQSEILENRRQLQ